MKNRKNWIHHDKKSFVNAPVINELPVTLEYELVKVIDESKYLGRIVNVSVDQGVLGEDGKISLEKYSPITYDSQALERARRGRGKCRLRHPGKN